jgi:cytochrome c peroxidase
MHRVSAPFAAILSLCLFIAPVSAETTPSSDVLKEKYRRPANIPFPDDNPYSEAKAKLGETLFFDPLFSGSGVRSCSTCHLPWLSWGDGLPRAMGENQKPLALRAPTLIDIAWIRTLGWDGKFRDLESVAFTPILSAGNMNQSEEKLIAAVSEISGYRGGFARAFPDGAITRRNIELALATFERTIVASKAPFDRWIDGDEEAIDEAAKRGFSVFNGKAGCANCHKGWNFTEGGFFDIGEAKDADIGRARLFPNSVKLQHAFKTPTLRDATRRAPYMHDGGLPSLEAVIELYDRGGIDRPSRSELIKPLHLTDAEKTDLLAFLKTLTGEPEGFSVPVLPR